MNANKNVVFFYYIFSFNRALCIVNFREKLNDIFKYEVLIEHHALKGLKLAVRKNLESILIFVGIIYKNKGKYFKKIKYKKDKEINYEKKEV